MQALYLDGPLLKMAHVSREKGAIKIEALRSHFYSADEKPPLALKENLVTGLDGGECVFRQLSLQVSGKRKVMQALPFQLEEAIPYPLEEAVVAPLLIPQPQSTLVNLFATTEEKVREHVDQFKKIGVDPEVVSAIPQALWRFCRYAAPKETNLHVVYLGMERIVFLSIIDGQLFLAQNISIGVRSFIEAMQKDFGMDEREFQQKSKDIPLSSLNLSELPLLQKAVHQFQKDIDRIFMYLQKKISDETVPLLLLGNLYSPLKCYDLLKPLFPAKHRWVELEIQANFDEAMLQAYAIPIGLGLDALQADSHQVQFRQKALLQPRVAQSRRKNVFLYAACCALACIAMWAGSSLIIEKWTNKLRQQVVQSTSVLKEKKGSLEELVDRWESTLASQKRTFAYFPSVPVVSDTLAWLCAHPLLAFSKEEKDQIEIKAFRYQLLEYPSIEAPTKGYKAQVDLELMITSGKLAKRFHDALHAEKGMIDQKSKISWQEEGNYYRVSFALKGGRS